MEPEKHSGLGIASFVLSLICAILMFILFGVAGVLESQPQGMGEGASIVVGLFLIFVMFLLFLSVALAVGGLMQSGRKKVFAVLGACFSLLVVVGSVALMILGAVVGD